MTPHEMDEYTGRMDSSERLKRLERIKRAIAERAFVRGTDAEIVSRSDDTKESKWLFDLRNILFDIDILDDAAAIFWDTFHGYHDVQIGCLESGGIPLATALVLLSAKHGGPRKPNGFFIRKSRKKSGLMKMVEGDATDNSPVVLVDDILNSGRSFIRQIEVLKESGKTVSAIWAIVRFRDTEYYEYFAKEGVEVRSAFELNDFSEALGVNNLPRKDTPSAKQAYKTLWRFSAPAPSYFHVVPKSEPAFDETRLYVGSDSGIFRALSQADGRVEWEFKTGLHPHGKGIFSSPALYGDMVYFGAYDGNIYALDVTNGKKRWVSFEADWVGSSPTVADDLGLVYIGLEFGLWRKRGGIIALDASSGEAKWRYTMPSLTHSSPLYIREHREVIIGSNDGAAYLFDAQSGVLKWKYESYTPSGPALDSGFCDGDIKASFAYDKKRDQVIFGNMLGEVHFIDRRRGIRNGFFKTDFGVYSTPLVVGENVFVSSLDKHLYSIDANAYTEQWRWHGNARIFSTPVHIDGSLYIGTNAGRLTEIDPQTGKERSYFTVPERITNRVFHNAKTGRFFLSTYANEIYCLEKII